RGGGPADVVRSGAQGLGWRLLVLGRLRGQVAVAAGGPRRGPRPVSAGAGPRRGRAPAAAEPQHLRGGGAVLVPVAFDGGNSENKASHVARLGNSHETALQIGKKKTPSKPETAAARAPAPAPVGAAALGLGGPLLSGRRGGRRLGLFGILRLEPGAPRT